MPRGTIFPSSQKIYGTESGVTEDFEFKLNQHVRREVNDVGHLLAKFESAHEGYFV